MRYRLPTVGAALIAVATGAICRAEASGSPTSDWRLALTAEYHYIPAAAAAPIPSVPKPPPGTVLLPTVVVEDRNPALAQLGSELQAAHQARKVDDQNKLLGIGFHSVGTKHFRVGYISVFHIPVFLLGGFSW